MAFTDRLGNRGSISTGPYEIENAIFLASLTTEEMHFTTSSSSSDNKLGTFSFWYKRSNTHYCTECSKRRLHFDMCHEFWTCMCARCLRDEILGLMNRENFQ